MQRANKTPTQALLVATRQTAGSALYGMLDVLSAAGNIWQELVRDHDMSRLFEVRIVCNLREPFTCGNEIPVRPHCCIADDPRADIVIIPDLWLDPDESLRGRETELMEWIRRCYARGSAIYSACSGALVLAETGL